MFKKKADKNLGAAVDIWALGVTLFYMLAGQHPHQRATDLNVLQHSICNVEIDFSLITNASSRAIIKRMLKINECDRASL